MGSRFQPILAKAADLGEEVGKTSLVEAIIKLIERCVECENLQGIVKIVGAAGATVLFPAVAFVGFGLLTARKDSKEKKEFEEHCTTVISLLRDIEKQSITIDAAAAQLDSIYDRKTWIWARISGADQADFAKRVAKELESSLRTLGLDTADRVDGLRIYAEETLAKLGDIEVKIDNIHRDTARTRQAIDTIVPMLLSQVSEKDQQIGSLRSQLEDAVRRLAQADQAGDASAKSKLKQLRAGGDPKVLGEFLDEQIAIQQQAQVDLLRERAAVAYTTGELDRTHQCLSTILALLPDDIQATNDLGYIFWILGDVPAAERQHKRVIELAREDDAWRAVALGNLGKLALTRSDLDAAERLLNDALAIERKLGRLIGQATPLGNLGIVAQTRGDLDAAEKLYNESLAINRELGLHQGQANQLGSLGNLASIRGDFDVAEKLYNESLEISRKIGHLKGQAIQLGNLGLIAQTRGAHDTAEKLYNESLAINRKLGRLEGQADQLCNLGIINQIRGDLGTAEKLHNESLAINRKLGRLEGQAAQLGNLGLIAMTRGDLDSAEKLLNESMAINRKLGSLEGYANDFGNLGNIARTRGDLDTAEKLYNESLAINRKLGRLEGQANDLSNLGEIAMLRGDLDAAEKLHNEALAINLKLGSLEGQANNFGNLGLIAKRRKNYSKARELWTQSRDLYARVGATQMEKKIQGWLDGLPQG